MQREPFRHSARKKRRFDNRLIVPALVLASSLLAGPVAAQTVAELQQLSIDELSNVKVTSVSKTPESLSDAAAAVYVITHDEIMRSGAHSLPEILRLAPNLEVAQISADSWAISARGFNGNAADKLLVLIDGRSVYTPLYSGVLWDEQEVLPENIERIEVISGPGATLWGANAVNGVINIITRKSKDTQGGVLDLIAGNHEEKASIQYGGALEDDLSYRSYLEGFRDGGDKTSTGVPAEDNWSKAQGGFRVDWTPQSDSITLEGDLYRGAEEDTPTIDQDVSGGNFEATWQHHLEDGSSFQLLAYFDATRRYAEGYGYSLNTYDFEFQHSFTYDSWNSIVWGAGYRAYEDDFNLPADSPVYFVPSSSTVSLADVFAQDTITLEPSLKFVAGLKLEADPYSNLQPLPNGRISWKVDEHTLLWAAVSRAVRAPTLFDDDLHDIVVPPIAPGQPPFLTLLGNGEFRPEQLTAYEIGTRMEATSTLSFSVSGYFNDYNDLRSVEFIKTTYPYLWEYGNNMEGTTYGVETWANYQATDWWKLSAGFTWQHEDLRFKPGSSGLGGVATAGDDPNDHATLSSSVALSDDVNWETDLRYVDKLPNPAVPGYVEANARLAWNVSPSLELSISGLNLLQKQHVEYEDDGAVIGDEVERSFFVESRWRF